MLENKAISEKITVNENSMSGSPIKNPENPNKTVFLFFLERRRQTMECQTVY